jgi:hypothetical protein
VPRFDPFDPEMLGVYDRFAVLGELACAACGKRMQVGIGRRPATTTSAMAPVATVAPARR